MCGSGNNGGGGGGGVYENVGVITARGGGDSGGDTRACGGGRSLSSIFLVQSLEREFTPIFLQLIARVCGGGGVPSPLIEPKMSREGKGPT